MDLKNVVLAKIYFWGDSRSGVLDLKIVVLAKTFFGGFQIWSFFAVVFLIRVGGGFFGDVGFTSSQVGSSSSSQEAQAEGITT